MLKNNKRMHYPLLAVFFLLLIPIFPLVSIEADSKSVEDSRENYDLESMFENHNSVMLIIDAQSGVILDANNAAVKFYGYTHDELLSMNISSINILSKLEIQQEMDSALKEERNYFEFQHRLKDGSIRYVEVYSSPASNESGNSVLYSIVHDVTASKIAEMKAEKERKFSYILLLSVIIILLIAFFSVNYLKRNERKHKENFKRLFEHIRYLSYHDQLTGLYNRYFFEEELTRLDVERNLPLSLAMIDVNGLKLTNDVFGHQTGDELLKKVADVLKKECRADDIISRIGGDEFVILLPKTGPKAAEEVFERVQQGIRNLPSEKVVTSISIGYETKENINTSIKELFAKAEDHMYRRKISESQEMRLQTIHKIMQSLECISEQEKIHGQRMVEICHRIGKSLKLEGDSLKEIEDMAKMHDIGKIAVDKRVLDKQGVYNSEDYTEIKKHPEIGYQILKTTDVYTKMAEAVLYHHERWDGNGYPRGIKGEAIPYYARILSIADAFEAMTSKRTYRQQISALEAFDEIVRGAGTQFDPNIVELCKTNNCFLELIS